MVGYHIYGCIKWLHNLILTKKKNHLRSPKTRICCSSVPSRNYDQLINGG